MALQNPFTVFYLTPYSEYFPYKHIEHILLAQRNTDSTMLYMQHYIIGRNGNISDELCRKTLTRIDLGVKYSDMVDMIDGGYTSTLYRLLGAYLNRYNNRNPAELQLPVGYTKEKFITVFQKIMSIGLRKSRVTRVTVATKIFSQKELIGRTLISKEQFVELADLKRNICGMIDPLKEKYLKRIRLHDNAENIFRGRWDFTSPNASIFLNTIITKKLQTFSFHDSSLEKAQQECRAIKLKKEAKRRRGKYDDEDITWINLERRRDIQSQVSTNAEMEMMTYKTLVNKRLIELNEESSTSINNRKRVDEATDSYTPKTSTLTMLSPAEISPDLPYPDDTNLKVRITFFPYY